MDLVCRPCRVGDRYTGFRTGFIMCWTVDEHNRRYGIVIYPDGSTEAELPNKIEVC